MALAAVAVGLERGVKAAEAVGALAHTDSRRTSADRFFQVDNITAINRLTTIRIRRRWKQWWMH